jgi:hypothetical protein
MLAQPHLDFRSHDALPVRLCRENLNGLLVVIEMLIPFFGRDLANAAGRLNELHFLIIGDDLQGTDTARKEFAQALRLLRKLCHELHWDRLEFQVEQALKTVRGADREALLTTYHQIELALLYECNHHVFFVLPERYRHLVEHWPGHIPFGPKVKHRFARSRVNIECAMRCLAFGLYTACVYHLIGILQEGINAIAKDLGARFSSRPHGKILSVNSMGSWP